MSMISYSRHARGVEAMLGNTEEEEEENERHEHIIMQMWMESMMVKEPLEPPYIRRAASIHR